MKQWLRPCWRRLRADRSGGTAIEFALVAPIFLVSAMALFQVGYGIYAHATLSRLAELGARQLLFAPDDRDAARQLMLKEAGELAIDPSQLTISIQTQTVPYSHLEVRLDYIHQVIGPVPLPEGVPLSVKALVPLAAKSG